MLKKHNFNSDKKEFSKNPLEIQRFDFAIKIQMEGRVQKYDEDLNGLKVTRSQWVDTKQIKAMAYDSQNAGYNTFNTISVRLWTAMPIFGSDIRSN
jgi:starch phosphorylase|tara:strand:+ start:148 stop:435 length:288 start_codon:yes stop_codon:yes gene_type:complete